MKKILLGLISIFTFGNVLAHVVIPKGDAVEFVENTDYIFPIDTKDVFNNYTDLFQDGSFTISPNPSKNKLNIRLPKASEKMTLEVFDVLGKRIHISTITQLQASVDVSSWKTGVYLVKVSNEKEVQTKRFIKQ